MKLKQSQLFTWNLRDLLRAFVVAFLTALVAGVSLSIDSGTFPSTWTAFKPIVWSSVVAGVAYLIKNFFTKKDPGT